MTSLQISTHNVLIANDACGLLITIAKLTLRIFDHFTSEITVVYMLAGLKRGEKF